jgi:hypothetical protein
MAILLIGFTKGKRPLEMTHRGFTDIGEGRRGEIIQIVNRCNRTFNWYGCVQVQTLAGWSDTREFLSITTNATVLPEGTVAVTVWVPSGTRRWRAHVCLWDARSATPANLVEQIRQFAAARLFFRPLACELYGPEFIGEQPQP